MSLHEYDFMKGYHKMKTICLFLLLFVFNTITQSGTIAISKIDWHGKEVEIAKDHIISGHTPPYDTCKGLAPDLQIVWPEISTL